MVKPQSEVTHDSHSEIRMSDRVLTIVQLKSQCCNTLQLYSSVEHVGEGYVLFCLPILLATSWTSSLHNHDYPAESVIFTTIFLIYIPYNYLKVVTIQVISHKH